MKVKLLEPLATKQGEIEKGNIVLIPDDLFNRLLGKVEAIGDTPKLICYSCRSSDFWQSVDQKWLCRSCHPPGTL